MTQLTWDSSSSTLIPPAPTPGSCLWISAPHSTPSPQLSSKTRPAGGSLNSCQTGSPGQSALEPHKAVCSLLYSSPSTPTTAPPATPLSNSLNLRMTQPSLDIG